MTSFTWAHRRCEIIVKCPNCGETLESLGHGLYQCPQCEVYGNTEKIDDIGRVIERINTQLKANGSERAHLEILRRLAISGYTHYAKKMLRPQVVVEPNPKRSPNEPGNPMPTSQKSKIGIMIGAIEIGGFIDWCIANGHGLANGAVEPVQAVIPLIFLIQGIFLLAISWM